MSNGNILHHPNFVRVHEMELINKAILKEGTTFIFIQGPGGVGKTRLLTEVYKKYQDYQNINVCPIIDLFNLTISHPLTLENTVIQKLKIKSKDYEDSYRNYLFLYTSEREDLLKPQIVNVQKEFIKALNSESENNNAKIILLFDTLDEPQVRENTFKKFVTEVLTKLNNAVILLAGRESINEFRNIDLFNENNSIFHELRSLKREEAIKLLLDEMDYKIKEKIFSYTDGNPLLMCLAQLLYEIDSKHLHQVLFDIENLQPEKQKQRFEEELIKPFANYNVENSKYILQMAYCQKRYDKDILCKLNNLNEEQAVEILNKLSTYFFIKPFDDTHLLHDALKDLLNKYYWERTDIPPTIRKEYFENLKKYYTDKIETFNKQLEELSKKQNDFEVQIKIEELRKKTDQYEVEMYFYQLTEEPDTAMQELSKKIASSLAANKLIYAGMLVNICSKFVDGFNPTDNNKDSYFMLKQQIGRYYRITGNYKKAKEVFEKLIEVDNDEKRSIEYIQNLGWVLKESGKPLEAIEKFKSALEKSKDEISKAWSYNNLAMVNNNIGKYQDAIKNLREAIIICQKNNIEYEEAFFSARLGFVYILNAEDHKAKTYLDISKKYFEKNRDKYEKELNIVKLYFAYYYAELGDFGSAESHFKEVEEYFRNSYDYYWLTITKVYKNWAEFIDFEDPEHGICLETNTFEEKLNFLNSSIDEASETNKDCLNYAVGYYPESLLVTGLLKLERAKLYEDNKAIIDQTKVDIEKEYEESKVLIEKALNEANGMSNLLVKAKAYAALAEYYFYRKDLEQLEALKQEFINEENFKDTVLEAYLGEINLFIGRLYYENKQYDKAFEYFNDCIGYLALPGLYPTFRFPEFVDEILSKLYDVVKKDGKYSKWLETFEKTWTENTKDRPEQNEVVKELIERYKNKIR